MSDRKVNLWNDIISGEKLILLAGPCVIESEKLCHHIASTLKELCDELNIQKRRQSLHLMACPFQLAHGAEVSGLSVGLRTTIWYGATSLI